MNAICRSRRANARQSLAVVIFVCAELLSSFGADPKSSTENESEYTNHLSSQAHLNGEERMTLSEVIAFLEVQPIEKSWKELIASEAGDEGIRRIAAEAGELMLNSPGPVAGAILGTVFSRLCQEARAA